jgi:hypothetical protein
MTSPSSHRIPYCNTSWSVRRTEELVGRLITETRSQLKCNCIESCSRIVYMYESESHTVLTSYGRIKVFKITNWNYSNFLKWFNYIRYFTIRLYGWLSTKSSSIRPSNSSAMRATFCVYSSELLSSHLSRRPITWPANWRFCVVVSQVHHHRYRKVYTNILFAAPRVRIDPIIYYYCCCVGYSIVHFYSPATLEKRNYIVYKEWWCV